MDIYGKPKSMVEEDEMIAKIKFRKVADAPYGCHATYEWEGHEIEGDTDTNFNGGYIWHCESLFKGIMFRTLKGLKRAIALKQLGRLTKGRLEICIEE